MLFLMFNLVSLCFSSALQNAFIKINKLINKHAGIYMSFIFSCVILLTQFVQMFVCLGQVVLISHSLFFGRLS